MKRAYLKTKITDENHLMRVPSAHIKTNYSLMKKTVKIIRIIPIFFLLLSLTTSCQKAMENALERAADSRETLAGMLSDADKVRGMFNSCYGGIPNNRMYLYFWTSEEELTDNSFDTQGQTMGDWRSGLLTPSYAAVWSTQATTNVYTNNNIGWWGRYWGALRMCNIFIENVKNITVPLELLPQSDRDLMKDEAIALRAYFQFKLISLYGPLPFLDTSFEIDFAGWKDLKRPTYDEAAKKIAADLQGVIDRKIIPLKRDPTNVNDKYRMPLGFVYGLKSRVLLYNASPLNNPTGDIAKYEAAAAAAKQLLDLNAYTLEPFANIKRMYISNYNVDLEAVEVIWKGRDPLAQLSNVAGMNLSATNPICSNYSIAKTGETPSQEIVDCYEMKNGALIIQNYDATHSKPTFTPEALAAGYDDVNNPYANRDARLSKDILYNGNYFGESYQLGPINVFTYLGCPGTGTNGNTTGGVNTKTYTGYYYAKDRDPLWYGKGTTANGNARCFQFSVYMRIAEIWLNYAEALCGAGRYDEACNALDKTRLRAGQPSIKAVPGYQAGNLQWLMKRIYNERRVELVLEDSRFYDVRRWNIISDVNNNAVSAILPEKVGNNYKYTRYQIPFVWACHNEKYKVLPIPLVDKVLLPGIDQPVAWQ
jgi:starch-binding outer membrane protein, SusD/RagB family